MEGKDFGVSVHVCLRGDEERHSLLLVDGIRTKKKSKNTNGEKPGRRVFHLVPEKFIAS